MAFKSAIMKIRRAVLCCTDREQQRPLEIGSPTDVRRIEINDSIPGLTHPVRRCIGEKTSSDAIHLLGLQSEPPSHTVTSPPSPTRSHSPSLAPRSVISSREPSLALLNAASKDLPSALPTPPIRAHHEDSPPPSRIKNMWQGPKRLSNSSTCHDELYEKLEQIKGAEVGEKGLTESFMTLNLDFDFGDKTSMHTSDSTRTLSLTDEFEMQNAKGGNCQPVAKNLVVQTAIEAARLSYSSDESDFENDDPDGDDHVQLVKI